MKSWKKPTNEMVDKALDSVKKVTARKYFFSRLENPLWLKPLTKRNCFKSPPKTQRFDDGTIQFPYWPEIQYLKNVCRDVPDEVISLVMELPPVDNPIVYDGILDIALQLPGEKSAILKPKILEYVGMDHQLRTYKYVDLLAHWTSENQTSAALELSKILVAFTTDPQSRSEDILPDPLPRMDISDYQDLMFKGIRPLAEKEPYQIALILIDTTANMIYLRTHPEDLDKKEDGSELWCQQLRESDSDYKTAEEALVHTLTFVCEKVFEKLSDAVVSLDKILRKKQWKVFKRLRQHLYTQYPNEQTKPWIRELILGHEDYHQSQHPYEFQQMIRAACEYFGETLLTKQERTRIFDAIRSGPPKKNFREWLGDEFTEERFQERQHYFHRQQLTPFSPMLFGEYKTYFQELEGEAEDPISDEDYRPIRSWFGLGSNQSPRSSEDLAALPDEVLLRCINEWEEEVTLHKNDGFIDVNIKSLAAELQTVFKESIIPDPNKLRFWMDNCEKIERPIYVQAMIKAMQAQVKDKNFEQLDKWLTFCEWVLTHLDPERGSDESRENPDWSSAHRAVCDFIGSCLEEDLDVPIAAQGQLAQLLEMLCTQFDFRLDRNQKILLNRDDPLFEAIHNTRSRALQNLVKFGLWLRKHNSDADISQVTTILERRFSPETDHSLTLPEYAILGKNYDQILKLNAAWGNKHKSDFFPQEMLPAWAASFGSFVLCSGSSKSIFKILQDDFDFALRHLMDFKKQNLYSREPIDILGQHLFTYYLWDMYPLRGDESLLERYYQQTDANRERWANLFNDIGRRLWNSGKNLDENIVDRVIDFFEWRFEQKEPMELRHFTTWLEAEALNAEWRLDTFSKILDICDIRNEPIRLSALCNMLPNNTAKVIECFAKLTANTAYIQTEEAKTILKAGLDSSDEDVRHKAKGALDNLLKSHRFELLDLDDSKT